MGPRFTCPSIRSVSEPFLRIPFCSVPQESGRAGRDGNSAWCVLYYSYGDAKKLRSMLKESAERDCAPPAVLKVNEEALNSMIAYCENENDCRRVLMLRHFGENGFTAANCEKTCDNCLSGAVRCTPQSHRHPSAPPALLFAAVCRRHPPCRPPPPKSRPFRTFLPPLSQFLPSSLFSPCLSPRQEYEEVDMWREACGLAEVVRFGGQSGGGGVSMTLAIDAFRGMQNQGVRQSDLASCPQFASGKDLRKSDAERLLKLLVVRGVLVERSSRVDNQWATPVTLLYCDERRRRELEERKVAVPMKFTLSAKAVEAAAKAKLQLEKKQGAASGAAPQRKRKRPAKNEPAIVRCPPSRLAASPRLAAGIVFRKAAV